MYLYVFMYICHKIRYVGIIIYTIYNVGIIIYTIYTLYINKYVYKIYLYWYIQQTQNEIRSSLK